ncbi:MAG: hypothetical protein QM758_06195 [Armatimonas sp.]
MDTKEKTLSSLSRVFHFFSQDIEALPEEAFARSQGGKARTVADIVHEVNLTNDCLRQHLLGEPVLIRPNAQTTAPDDLNTKDAVMQSFKTSSGQVIQAVKQLSVAQMEETIPGETGEGTRADHCRAMTVHLWYHSGQLNYIQTLLGDDAMHWS